ncbi:MAG: Ti-type conjugative transfer relaxase TraA, partial [Deltaproteobacteria bacterium]
MQLQHPMAVPHISVQIIGRSQGRSAVAAAAYRSAERLVDERLGRTSDFSRKQGVVHTEILAPEGAPVWVHNRATLWNRVEAAENRRDAQVAREVQVALPRELAFDKQLALVRGYVQEHFVSAGMVADVAVHMDNPKNPHAHVMLTTRGLNAEGTGFGPKVRAWNAKAQLLGWREGWALSVNRALERDGHDNRIDHRSYVDQGIDLEPTPKLGIGTAHGGHDGRDCIAERLAAHDATVRRNGEAIFIDPEIALTGITHQRATFTRADMGRYLHTYTANAEQFQACLDAVMASPSLVRLETESHGARFTTQEMLQAERTLVDTAHRLVKKPLSHAHAVDMRHTSAAVAGLAREPRQAVGYVVGTDDIALVEGYAGAGKSTMLRAAKQAWDAGGYRVLGAALSGKAAEGLEVSAGIASRSLASWEYGWKQGHDTLGPKDIFVIDEAGLVGTRQMQRVLSAVEDAGAKVVMVGDSQQLQAIEAGAPFRCLTMEVGRFAMTNIQRQQDPAQREASLEFARGYGAQGLDYYAKAGCVTAHADGEAAMAALVDGWDQHRKAQPEDSHIMLAFRRVEVAALNAAARDRRVEAGEMGAAHSVATAAGDRDFAIGDRLYFLRNDRGLGVKNGTLGTLEDVQGTTLQVCLDGPEMRRVAFDTADYNHLDYGYAATVHKAQGVTVDQAHVLASSHFDRHVGYVAMTRHRDNVQLHYSQQDFASVYDLSQAFERARPKDMALDYAVAEARNQAQADDLRERERAAVA